MALNNAAEGYLGVRSAPIMALILCVFMASLWSTDSLAQRSRSSPVRQEIDLTRPDAPGSPVTPVALPVANPSSALGSALASCEAKADGSELVLPAARGEIKLDRCYRGRDHLVCQFNALSAEAKSLFENYRKVIDANYPEVRDVAAICAIAPETLVNDIKSATEFQTRFKEFKSEYDARSKCASRVQQSFMQVTLSDMPQAQTLVKSMTEAIDGDVKGVSELQGRMTELADKMDISYRAMLTLQKIHRAMCASAKVEAVERGSK
jgi:hypothetical protein